MELREQRLWGSSEQTVMEPQERDTGVLGPWMTVIVVSKK